MTAPSEPVYETEEYQLITRIVDHGTIVAVHLSKGRIVYFDHRPFGHMVEARGGIENVGGQRVRYIDHGEFETLAFEDEE